MPQGSMSMPSHGMPFPMERLDGVLVTLYGNAGQIVRYP